MIRGNELCLADKVNWIETWASSINDGRKKPEIFYNLLVHVTEFEEVCLLKTVGKFANFTLKIEINAVKPSVKQL